MTVHLPRIRPLHRRTLPNIRILRQRLKRKRVTLLQASGHVGVTTIRWIVAGGRRRIIVVAVSAVAGVRYTRVRTLGPVRSIIVVIIERVTARQAVTTLGGRLRRAT